MVDVEDRVGSLLELVHITKTYQGPEGGVAALDDVSMAIEEGDFAAVMGPSGSGKSTLLTILGAMNPPTSGKMYVDGIDVYGLSVERLADFRKRYLGFVFQQHQLIPYLTAAENVMLPLVICECDGSKPAMAERALERVGLAGMGGRLPNQLSGGEQGRVAIARAVVNEPVIVLADEPTGALDSQTGEEIMALFKQLNDDGHTIVMVTHNHENAAHAKRIVCLKDGRLPDSEEASSGTYCVK
ncbi:MAG: ABC transporter ATP-binding protein [Actinobacteria bacterium]|nr:MAG: ABC transporter ATP-binding protein [Actinomycetota bacterium]